jgi:sarcosine oxidase subunit gamma
MPELEPVTPLAGRPAIGRPGAPVHVFEAPFSAKFALRLAEAEPERLDGPLGLALPRDPLRAAFAEDIGAMRLGPDEWMVVAAPGRAEALEAAVNRTLDGVHAAFVDISHRMTEIAIEGPAWRELLAAGCPLDLDPETAPAGFASRSLLGRSEIVLVVREADAASLFVDRSFAPYAMDFLEEAARSLLAAP